MANDARRRALRKWRQARSEHAELLRGLERAIAAHPAGGRTVSRRTDASTTVSRKPRDHGDGPDAA